jgi:hypothetical protein
MPATLIFHRLVAREYRSARDRYTASSPAVGERFRLAVARAAERIEAAIGALPKLDGPYRYIRVSGFPYILVFRPIDARIVMVVAVAHTSRRQGYWRGRKWIGGT